MGASGGRANPRASDAPQPRRGLGGRLASCLVRTALAIAFCCVLLLAMDGLLYPYAFTLGGHFHLNPYWTGWGKAHVDSAGGDYFVYVNIGPWANAHAVYPESVLKGRGYLCTPRGEIFPLYVTGGMPRMWKGPTVGSHVTLGMDYWRRFYGNLQGDHRPSIKVQGTWVDRGIEGNDGKSFSRAFLSDGTVFRNQPGVTRPAGLIS